MTWEPWPFTEQRTLARYANPLAAALLPPPQPGAPNPTDLRRSLDGKRETVRLIYERIGGCGIQYARVQFDYTGGVQPIRQPGAILQAPREATCLDLALLFGAICLHYELLPLLVMLKEHALIAVSRKQYRRDAEQGDRDELYLFEQGLMPTDKQQSLCELVDKGAYMLLECTGVAYGLTLEGPEGQGRQAGLLSFERAEQAGREQLDRAGRPFQYALDLHEIQRTLRPYPIAGIGGAPWIDGRTQQTIVEAQQRIVALEGALSRPGTGGRAAEIRRKALRRRLEAREEEYEAVMRRIESILDPGAEVRLRRAAEDLLEEIAQIEAELKGLG